MHLKADEPAATELVTALLNGKPVPMTHEVEMEKYVVWNISEEGSQEKALLIRGQGWIKSYSADLPENMAKNGAELIDNPQNTANLYLIKREGLVELVFRPDTTFLEKKYDS